MPMCKLVGRCARAASGHVTAETTAALTKSRRRIASPKARNYATPPGRLQQQFATDEMGVRGQFAGQQSETAHVRFGSKADMTL
jgi:hypothetical protein